jgi:hypothetical protein
MPKKQPLDKWTIVQHSGYGYNLDPVFARAVETRSVSTKAEENRVLKVGGILFDSYTEASDFEDDVNGVSGDRPFLKVEGTFSDKDIDGLKIYIPKREVVG